MGKNIGSLGRQRDPLDLEFDYFGTTLRVHPFASDEVEIEFLEAGRNIDMDELSDLDLAKFDQLDDAAQLKALRDLTTAQREGYKAMMRSLRRLVHPDDFDAYWKIGGERGQQVTDRMADVKAITSAVIEATTDFPIGPPSTSPDGPPETRPSSGDISFSLVASDFDKAMALERGRPDIQEFFVMEKEARDLEAAQAAAQNAADMEKLRAAGLA